MKTHLVYIIVISRIYAIGKCGNILALMGGTTPSHLIWNSVLVEELAGKGHNITAISVDLPDVVPDNLTYIYLEKTYETIYEKHGIDIMDFARASSFGEVYYFYEYDLITCKGILESEGLNILMAYPDDFKFDLILYDFTMGPCLAGFIHKFHYPPVVGMTAFRHMPFITEFIGGHNYPAYVPFYSANFNSEMNTIQRIYNVAIYFADHWCRELILLPKMQALVRPYYPIDTPPLKTLESLMQIVLLNTHPATDYVQPNLPNLVEVGGLQIKAPNPLSYEIENFIIRSKKGAVFISLGTNIQNSDLGDKLEIILKTIKHLPDYNFLWKFDKTDSQIGNRVFPSNVLLKKWFPQRDILAHPQIKLFVTHGGGLSSHETTWFGVPVIGLPFFVDQPRNLQRLVEAGAAETVNPLEMSFEDFFEKVKRFLENGTYREKMRKLSDLFRDRPMKPLDTAVWHIEYVMRHPNLEILRPPTIALGYIRSNLLDIYFYFTVLFVILLWSVTRIMKYFCGMRKRKIKIN